MGCGLSRGPKRAQEEMWDARGHLGEVAMGWMWGARGLWGCPWGATGEVAMGCGVPVGC